MARAIVTVTVTVVAAVLEDDVYDDFDQELNIILENHVDHLYGAAGEVVSQKMKR